MTYGLNRVHVLAAKLEDAFTTEEFSATHHAPNVLEDFTKDNTQLESAIKLLQAKARLFTLDPTRIKILHPPKKISYMILDFQQHVENLKQLTDRRDVTSWIYDLQKVVLTKASVLVYAMAIDRLIAKSGVISTEWAYWDQVYRQRQWSLLYAIQCRCWSTRVLSYIRLYV